MADFIKITVYFHNVFKSVPDGYERDFVDNVRRCGYVRLFFPQFLSPEITEILYLDTDTIITGNIAQIWKEFKEKVVTLSDRERPSQLAAMVQNSEVFGKVFEGIYKDNFGMIPHVPPRGVNSGVIFMNLEAMRAFNWTEKILKLYIAKRGSVGGDQQLINIFLHDYLDRLILFPCQYNFQHLHCEEELTCTGIVTDPGGIQIMHGAGDTFHKVGRSHVRLYESFKEFKLENHLIVEESLFQPLRQFYSRKLDKKNGRTTCQGAIGMHLFKQSVNLGTSEKVNLKTTVTTSVKPTSRHNNMTK